MTPRPSPACALNRFACSPDKTGPGTHSACRTGACMSDAAPAALRIFRPAKPSAALGLAVSHLMVKPAFASLKFGDWSRILVGQINRGHYRFAIDADNRVQGFMGWALASREHAEAWVEGRRGLSF